jgi:hypothetical protein
MEAETDPEVQPAQGPKDVEAVIIEMNLSILLAKRVLMSGY